jgi:acyl dehydratase
VTGAERLAPAGWRLLARALLKRRSTTAFPSEGLDRTFEGEALDDAHVERYNALLGFPPGAVPLTYFYLLAQRAQLQTMLSPAFPFAFAGMVHASNELALHRPVGSARPFTLRATARQQPPTRSGAIFVDLDVAFEQDGALVVSSASRVLAKRGRRTGGSDAAREVPAPKEWPEIARWRLAPDTGRRYARVSGDFNPIHLWPWSARLFGLSRPIIHGMHTAGRALAAIETATGATATAVEVQFHRPIGMGSDVALRFDAATGEFEVWGGDVLAATGRVTAG